MTTRPKYEVGETIEPVLDRIADWSCEVTKVFEDGEGGILSAQAVMTLPYIDTELTVCVDADENILWGPTPMDGITWYMVVGHDEDGRAIEQSFLDREQAFTRLLMLDPSSVVRTYRNAVIQRTHERLQVWRELVAAEAEKSNA